MLDEQDRLALRVEQSMVTGRHAEALRGLRDLRAGQRAVRELVDTRTRNREMPVEMSAIY
jgi:hypothetical protein